MPIISLTIPDPWDPKQKNKFPDEFKPLVRECGRAAFHNKMFELADDEDSKFFHALPSVLPYNTFTLTVSCLLADDSK